MLSGFIGVIGLASFLDADWFRGVVVKLSRTIAPGPRRTPDRSRRDIVTAPELALRASKRARSHVIRGDIRLTEPITPAPEDVRPDSG